MAVMTLLCCSVSPGVTILDLQDCSLSAVFLVALAAFLDDSQDDVAPIASRGCLMLFLLTAVCTGHA
jgi:hypothetical protein